MQATHPVHVRLIQRQCHHHASEGRSDFANTYRLPDDTTDDSHSNPVKIFMPRTELYRTPLPTSGYTSNFKNYQPDSPSPLRCVVNGDAIAAASENSSQSTSIPRLPETPTNTYEVPGAFLNAMVGLLERQANIVPEHLYTKMDLEKAKEAVRKEMQEKQATVTPPSPPESSWAESSVAVLGSVTAVAVCAGVNLFRRASHAHPELMWYYLDGACWGAAGGLVGVLLFKGMLETFDGRRGFYF